MPLRQALGSGRIGFPRASRGARISNAQSNRTTAIHTDFEARYWPGQVLIEKQRLAEELNSEKEKILTVAQTRIHNDPRSATRDPESNHPWEENALA